MRDVVQVTDDAATLYSFARNLVVVASAGTGKTHSLVGVLVHLMMGSCSEGAALRAPVDPVRLVATTFSRKAAAEIQARLTMELGRLVNHDAEAAYRGNILLACDRAGVARWNDDEIAERARRALDGVGRAEVGTLHGYATSLVRAHALELGLAPGFEFADEALSRERAQDAVERVLGARADTGDESLASLAQAAGGADRLAFHIVSLLDRLAEDGRGAAELACDDGDAQRIDAKMQVLLEHARSLEGDRALGPAAAALLAAHASGAPADVVPAVTALCSVAARGTKSPAAEAFFAFRSELPGASIGEKGRAFAQLWRSRAKIAPCADVAWALLVESEQAIRREALREGILGFGDVLRAARDLLRDRPDVAAQVGAGVDALLVDEFQDTSRLQRDLVQLLWEREPGARRPGTIAPLSRVRPRGLLVVGDRKQSIYGFRGADVAVFAELCVGLAGGRAREALGITAGSVWEPEEPTADFVALRHNRRGRPELLSFANAYSSVRLRPESTPAELFEIDYVPATEDLLPPPSSEPASLATPGGPATVKRTVWLRVPVRGPGATSLRLDEAGAMAERIVAILRDGKPTVRGHAPRWADIAVLALRHDTLDATAFALARAGVPYVVAGKGFYAAREVRDLAAILALVCNPGDKLALLEVLRGPWAGVRDESLLGLTAQHRGLQELKDWERGERRGFIRPEDRAPLAALRTVVERLRAVSDRLGAAGILREAVRALDLEEVLIQLPRGEQRVANVHKLIAIAERAQGARAFLDKLNRAADRETAEAEAATFSEEDDAVRLLTVHASKGLDFPIVFLPEVGAQMRSDSRGPIAVELTAGIAAGASAGEGPLAVSGRLSVRYADDEGFVHEPPSYATARARAQRRDYAERVRLAYVAATRASEAMFFVGNRRVPSAGPTDAYRRTTAGALLELAADDASCARAELLVVDVPLPAAGPLDARAPIATEESWEPAPRVDLATGWRPAWRSLPIATTALQDFHHCPRRFQLAALLDLPEHTDAAPAPSQPSAPRRAHAAPPRHALHLDARALGTLAHRVLERIDSSLFGQEDSSEQASALLVRIGLAKDQPQHTEIVERVARFLRGPYARRVSLDGAEVRRELAFVLRLDDASAAPARTLVLRGTIDLLVAWPDGSVDVVDYKRARVASAEPYALQLDAYTLAAQELVPGATAVRAGLLFLGGDAAEPSWRKSAGPAALRDQLASLAARLVLARWSESFPRVELPRCQAIRCGYVGLCHGEQGPRQLRLFDAP